MMATREQARARTRYAIETGRLTRPEACELCGVSPGKINKRCNARIVAHHWRGYKHPFDVWFICKACNAILKDYHDGSLNKEQARALVAEHLKWYDKPDYTLGYKTPLQYSKENT